MSAKIKMGNLVILCYASNNCYTTLMSLKEYGEKDPAFCVNSDEGTWSNRTWNNVKIGGRRNHYYPASTDECREGIIGVYDRMDFKQLSSMVSDANEAVRPKNLNCVNYD